jgi:hypothetical protein
LGEIAMTIARPILLLLLVAPLMALVGSCVESQHPLSDEKSSKLDERLIGTWRFEDAPGCLQVKKSADAKNALEFIETDPAAGKTLLFTTTIKSKGYMSIKDTDEHAKKGPGAPRYNIYQYVFLDNDTVQFRAMDPKVIEKAIADKTLGGEFEPTRTIFAKKRRPIITAAPQVIARYLEAHFDECYPAKEETTLIWKRQSPASPDQLR